MKALQLFGDRDLRLGEVEPPPPPGAGEVQIRVRAVGLNHIDVWGFRGMAFVRRKLPVVVGAEASGEIVSLGHAFEQNTPIRWAQEMQAAVGGALLTVQDDVHVSSEDLPCASKDVDFLVNGKTSDGTCAGAPIPAPASS